MGKVIRGVSQTIVQILFMLFLQVASMLIGLCCTSQWDEALLTMSKGEKAKLEIEPEWAYGKKGVPDSKYPLTLCV